MAKKSLAGWLWALLGIVGAAMAQLPQPPEKQPAGEPRRQWWEVLPPAPISGTLEATRLSTPERQGEFPALACDARGDLWAAWVEWTGRSDRLLVSSSAKGWKELQGMAEGSPDLSSPTLVRSGEEIWAFWSAQVQGNWDIYGRRVHPSPTPIERLTEHPAPDFNTVAVADGQGRITVVWQSFREGNGDVFLRQRVGGVWRSPIRVSPSEANDWEPSAAVDGMGTVHIVWDTYETGDYNVCLRSFDGERLGPVRWVTSSPRAEFHASVACDAQGRVWVAWDEAEENWGKDFSSGSRVSAPGSRGLHASRTLGLRVWAQGRWWEPKHPIRDILVGQMGRFAELPQLIADEKGQMWLLFRHWSGHNPTEIFEFFVTTLTSEGWALPWRLANSTGRNTQRGALAVGPQGRVWVAYASDGRGPGVSHPSAEEALKYNVYLAQLPEGRGEQGGLVPVEVSEPQGRFVAKPRYRTTLGGRTFYLLYGDLHRHTDIRGHNGVDGSIEDTYRYALDPAQLDFVATTDHNQVEAGRWADGLRDYSWWWTQKAADMMHHPPRFLTLYGYEHSLGTPSGHRNVFFHRRGGGLRIADRRLEQDNLPPRLWEWLRGQIGLGFRVVDIPHTFAERTQPRALWDWPNPVQEPLLEIYQGARSSYEAAGLPEGLRRGRSQLETGPHFAQDALRQGRKYGFIASSDHGSTHNSYACVYVDDLSREALMEGFLARRTFAASDDILLDARMNGHWMGEAFRLAEPPRLEVFVRANNTILRVDVVRNGEHIYTLEPKRQECRFLYTDNQPLRGESWYYVRIVQEDVENPQGDPEMAWGSPFFVTFGE